ncbi:SpoIIE family protein phosphatase [Bacillus sp. SG-1]|uniref:SpoIIE family protein phosphatase n=1 Tax=Bacillus sp. SG-1 TaxID=161544 RepID=UPI0001545498|nr:SpoIIE family protein phosphatase [Bacillus sp. SG-1]EDL64473.1 serine phosphatase [Bacillus sp. SG-1]
MDEQLNQAPCGFLTLSKEGIILTINQTLLQVLGYNSDQLVGRHINSILSGSARVFFQLYFIPLVTVKHRVEEMYLSLAHYSGDDMPVLINASLKKNQENQVIMCVIVPIHRRSEYENQLLIAKKVAEDALKEKNKANFELERALKTLEAKQQELLEVNKQNEKYRIDTQRELQLAKKIQETSLTEALSNDHLHVESYYKASSELSGDIYGIYQINEHQYGVIVLDVMGHGISSALITMSLQSLFQRLISTGAAANIVMKELDNHLHRLFHSNENAWHYCTAIYLFIDTDKQIIEYINAGHPPAIYQGPKGKQQELHSSTPPIGTFEGIDFKTNTITYTKGGRVLLYTDGVSEPLEPNHLCSLLSEHSSLSSTQLKDKILESLKKEKDDHYKDDQCFIVIDLK